MPLVTADAQDLDQGSSLLYGSPFQMNRIRREPGQEKLRVSEAELLKMGLVTIRRHRLRHGFQIGRIEEHLQRRLDGEGCELSRRVPVAIAVALSTPDWPDAYVASSRHPKEAPRGRCRDCRHEIELDELFIMQDDSDPALPRLCLGCVREWAGITEPIEDGDASALRWIERRLVFFGRLPEARNA